MSRNSLLEWTGQERSSFLFATKMVQTQKVTKTQDLRKLLVKEGNWNQRPPAVCPSFTLSQKSQASTKNFLLAKMLRAKKLPVRGKSEIGTHQIHPASGRYALMKVSTSRRVSWEGEDLPGSKAGADGPHKNEPEKKKKSEFTQEPFKFGIQFRRF